VKEPEFYDHIMAIMHDAGCEYGRRKLEEAGSMASFFLVLDKGQVKALPAPWQSQDEKPAYIAAIRRILKERKINVYTFVTEAWVATVDPRIEAELINVAPRDRSNRKDVLMILSRTRSGNQMVSMYNVEYSANRKVTLTRAEDMESGDFNMGLIGNLFEKERPVRL